MDTRNYILQCLRDHINECYEGPNTYPMRWKNKKIFTRKSYERWAADEFYNYLRVSGPGLYISAKRFVALMAEYSDRASTEKRQYIFEIAHEVAECLLDFMYALK